MHAETIIWEPCYVTMMPQIAVTVCSEDCGTISAKVINLSAQAKEWPYGKLKLFALTQLTVTLTTLLFDCLHSMA